MAVSSGVYGPFLRDAINNNVAFDLTSDTLNVALVADAHTPNFDTHAEFTDITNEVTGTGWSAGGVALTTNTWTIATGLATFDADDVSESDTTLTDAEAAVIYDATLANDNLICMVDFGSAFSTSDGTFAITWHANGIFRINYTP